MDSGVERVVESVGAEDAPKSAAGNSEHACRVTYTAAHAALHPRLGSRKLELDVAPDTSLAVFPKLELAMRSAGHTAFKEYTTHDGTFTLVRASSRRRTPARWLTASRARRAERLIISGSPQVAACFHGLAKRLPGDRQQGIIKRWGFLERNRCCARGRRARLYRGASRLPRRRHRADSAERAYGAVVRSYATRTSTPAQRSTRWAANRQLVDAATQAVCPPTANPRSRFGAEARSRVPLRNTNLFFRQDDQDRQKGDLSSWSTAPSRAGDLMGVLLTPEAENKPVCALTADDVVNAFASTTRPPT